MAETWACLHVRACARLEVAGALAYHHLPIDRAVFGSELVDLLEMQETVFAADALQVQRDARAETRLRAEICIKSSPPLLRVLAEAQLAGFDARRTSPSDVESRAGIIELLERALILDPGSVDARVLIAGILVSDIADGLSSAIEQDEARADLLISEALELNPNHLEARRVMGHLRRVQR